MRHQFFAGAALAALIAPSMAFAQSTGTVEAEQSTIIVTAASNKNGVAGHVIPDTSKAKAVLTQELIGRQGAGQTVNDIINQLPGVSFTNNDPFGSAGGTISIRGFDGSRVSQTFDGVPLNDTGSYAVFSNQQLDPELIEQVNVNLGSTDVDSPTASASGSTVNYRTMNPSETLGARLSASLGEFNFRRVFGMINTGNLTSFGTRAWFSASTATNNNVFNNYGKIAKQQYNGKIYQPIGDNGDFISIGGHYNQNRNNFFGSVPLRIDTVQSPTNGAVRVVGTGSGNRFPTTAAERFYDVPICATAVGVTGVANTANSCGTLFDYRFNPSNTGNIRINSRFTIAPGLVLSVDPSFQYVKANGGGTSTAREGLRAYTSGGVTSNIPGYFGGSPFVGGDLNGDGDTLDQVLVSAPSETRTRRWGVIASLRWDFAEGQSLRAGYSHDYGNHRQTGEIIRLSAQGVPLDPFPINSPIVGSTGYALQKRDRQSFAILDQISGEYRGKFFDNKLSVNVGLRAPYFTRDLNNYCFTTAANGNVDCLGLGNAAANTIYKAANPAAAAPQQRILKYNKVLPSLGATYKFTPELSLFANYSKGLQVPGTDFLYQSFFFALGNPQASPSPETTDNFDAGLRFSSSKIQAQLGPWYTRFTNRLASAYDPVLDQSVYRNLGNVSKYGFDGSVAYRPIKQLSFYVFGSYLKSKIQSDVQIGICSATVSASCAAAGTPILALTAGKRESGSPVYTLGGRIQGDVGPVSLGIQAKRTGKRYINDQNLAITLCTVAFTNQVDCKGGTSYQVYGATTPEFTTVDLDLRFSMGSIGLNDKSYLQLNVSNLFDTLYAGNFGGNTLTNGIPNAQIGSPRAVSGTLNIAF
jgi:iron complex outermembrane recepter protein